MTENGRAGLLTIAAHEAWRQGRFHEFLAVAFARDRSPRASELPDIARAAGVDYREIMRASRAGRHTAAIQRTDAMWLRRRGSTYLPQIVLDGVAPAQRPMTLDEYEELYDRAYTRARAALDDGVAIERLHDDLVREADADRQPVPITRGRVDGEPSGTEAEPIAMTRIVAGAYDLSGPLARGPTNARLVAVLACDFQSRNCSDLARNLEQLRSAYHGQLKVVFKHLFADEDDGEHSARLTHEASLCARDQGAFWEFYDLLFVRKRFRSGPLTASDLERRASILELDVEAFAQCLERHRHIGEIDADLAAAREAHIERTPALILNGYLMYGTKTFEQLRQVVDRELQPGWLERAAPRPPKR
jgi:protein-disulfide isomerase